MNGPWIRPTVVQGVDAGVYLVQSTATVTDKLSWSNLAAATNGGSMVVDTITGPMFFRVKPLDCHEPALSVPMFPMQSAGVKDKAPTSAATQFLEQERRANAN